MKLTKTAKILIGVAIGLVAISLVLKTCRVYDKESILMGKYLQEKMRTKEQVKLLNADIEKLQKSIRDKNYLLDQKEGEIAVKQQEIKKANESLHALEVEFTGLLTVEERLRNMTSQRDEWRNKFSLADGIIKDKDVQIDLWRGKYNAAMKIADDYRILSFQWEQQDNACEVVRKAISSELVKARLFGKLKTGLVITAAGVILYGLVKNKGTAP